MNDPTDAPEKSLRQTPSANDVLLPLVYDELRKIAGSKLRQEAKLHTLQATELVHEAWLRLGGGDQPRWESRAHFFGAAAEAMRRILIERARRRRRYRHGGGQQRVDIDEIDFAAVAQNEDVLLAIDEALTKLALLHPAKAELVKLRYFTGLKIEEAAQNLGIAEPTAHRWWAYARAWLYREMKLRPGLKSAGKKSFSQST